MRRYSLIIVSEVSLETRAVSKGAGIMDHASWANVMNTHIDDGNDIGCSVVEFA